MFIYSIRKWERLPREWFCLIILPENYLKIVYKVEKPIKHKKLKNNLENHESNLKNQEKKPWKLMENHEKTSKKLLKLLEKPWKKLGKPWNQVKNLWKKLKIMKKIQKSWK